MKKIIICGALFNLICTPVLALQDQDTETSPSKTKSSVVNKTSPRSAATQYKQTKNTEQEQHPNLQQSPLISSNAQTNQDVPIEQLKEAVINCDSRISAETININQDFILSWAEHAVTQSFDFNLASLDTQLQKLQSCYTQKGWVGFTAALQKSGNLDAIKTQNLMVSSTLDGQAQLLHANDNQWKITLPLKVVYHNDIEEETHFLNIYLTIGWKNAFGLGITQMIATPRSAPLSQKATTLRDALQSIYFAAANKRSDGVEQITPFVASLFQKKPRDSFPHADIIHSQADLTIKRPKKPTRQIPLLAQSRPYPASHDVPMPHQIQTAQNRIPPIFNRSHETPSDTVKMNKIFVLNGLKSASNRMFDFKPAFLASLQKFQGYEKKSWDGLYTAVQKLSYIEAIKTPKLTVNSQKDRHPELVETQNNQWKITLPMQVVYQNDKNKVTQLLNVNLTVDRTSTGELGITQIIATSNGTSPQATKNSSSDADKISNQEGLRADSVQKKEPNNTTQLAQSLTLEQPPKGLQRALTAHKTLAEPVKKTEIINCNYKIPAETKKIDEALVLTWAKYAATQSFDFNSAFIETQLQQLHSCYTEKGWIEFKTALQKSGNIEAIKTQKLMVNSEVDGQLQLMEVKDNQWKVALPLRTVYRSDQGEIVQLLNINLTIGRKITGEFGIMQMIATPRIASVAPKIAPAFLPNQLALQVEVSQKKPQNNVTQLQPQSSVLQQSPQESPHAEPSQPVSEQLKKAEISCDYKIPPETQKIDEALVLSWAVQAAIQSFDFNFSSIDAQLQQLQSCYTESGWGEFKNALQKAGNIEAFKTQKLTAISRMDGRARLVESKGNQWKITLPMHVIYQNDKGNVTQLLQVNLIVGRKNTGELGIMQLNSVLRNAAPSEFSHN